MTEPARRHDTYENRLNCPGCGAAVAAPYPMTPEVVETFRTAHAGCGDG